MLLISQIIMDLSTTILAILTGLMAYRKLPIFYRILFFQALIYLLIDGYASTIRTNNNSIFNINILVEIGLVFFAAYKYFNTVNSKRTIMGFGFLFLFIFILDILDLGFYQFAYHAYLAGGISITGIFLAILFFHFLNKKDSFYTSALVLTCLGIVIYFACMTPYLSMMNRFQEQSASSNKEIFKLIIVNLGHLRYFLLAIAFLIHCKPFHFNLQNKVR